MHKAKQFFFAGIISVQERRTAYEPKKIIKRIKLAGQISVRWSDGWSGKCKDDAGYHTFVVMISVYADIYSKWYKILFYVSGWVKWKKTSYFFR